MNDYDRNTLTRYLKTMLLAAMFAIMPMAGPRTAYASEAEAAALPAEGPETSAPETGAEQGDNDAAQLPETQAAPAQEAQPQEAGIEGSGTEEAAPDSGAEAYMPDLSEGPGAFRSEEDAAADTGGTAAAEGGETAEGLAAGSGGAADTGAAEETEGQEYQTVGYITASYNGTGGGAVFTARGFSLTEEQLRWITACCIEENGADANALRYEASLLANLTDEKGAAASPYDVINSGWYARSTRARAKKRLGSVTQEQVDVVRDVLCGGHRITKANEHDCFSDIKKIVTMGTSYTSQAAIRNRGNYVPGNTVIYNRMGSVYLFETFPTSRSDPFGTKM